MNGKIHWKSIAPTMVAIVVFFLIALAYFPQVLEGERIAGHDNANIRGMAREINEYNESTGDVALWTGSMFGGMPTFMIRLPYKGNVLRYLDKVLNLGPRPVSFVFLYLIGFYILLLVLRINPWLAIAGAIAFAFSSYNFVIIAAGHNTKAIAIGYMAPILAGILLTFRGKWLLGAALTAIALSLQIRANHLQITYYTLMMVVFLGSSQLIFAIREKQAKKLMTALGILILAALLGALSNTDRLWTTVEYSQYTMRNPSELSGEAEDKTSGLTKSYATAWSYGIDETLSLLIPGVKGGSSAGSLTENSATYELFARSNPGQAREVIKQLPLYWGGQSSTMGNVYVGAIVVFLFVLGMFLADPKIKWWLFAASLLGIMLAWGSNFMGLTDFFMEHVPGYNKFRTVSMTLVIPALAMPILAVVVLNKIFSNAVPKKELLRGLKWAVGITGGLSLLLFLLPDIAGNFVSVRDSSYQPELADALQADRRSLLRMDALRSLIFILLAAGVLLLYERKTLKLNLAIGVMALLFLVDMWPVNKRYLNSSHFASKREAKAPFQASPADQFIMQQEGHNQRVLNLTVAMFQDASTSYFHPSIGGYHGAKLRRYQDIMETGLQDDIGTLYQALQTQNLPVVDSALSTTRFLNLLNTRYIIINPNTSPIVNRHAPGNAWFVHQVKVVENADADIEAIAGLDIGSTCTIDQRYANDLPNTSYATDSTSSIVLAEYSPNRMVYRSSSEKDQFAVFSEVYYPEGWTATIDGTEKPHFRVDYLLRGMEVPAGEHEIVFEFRPESYFRGTMISRISSILLVLLALGAIVAEFRKNREPKTENQ